MQRNAVHLLDGIFEGFGSHAPRGQHCVENGPANAGTRESKHVFLICFGTENHFRPSFSFLKSSCYSAVAADTAGKNDRSLNAFSSLEAFCAFVPGNIRFVAQLNSSFISVTRKMKDVVFIL